MRLPTARKHGGLTRKTALRLGAVGALAAAAIVPHVRHRLRIPAAVTVASTVAAPLAIAVLWPRSRKRDAALFFGQMWAFAVSHELPYDNPEKLRSRLRIDYPIKIDRWIGGGELPNARLQRTLQRGRYGGTLTRLSAWTHWAWFAQPYLALVWILLRHNDRLPQSARQMAVTFDIGCAMYFLAPTAPPWWASENGYTDDEVRRVMIEFGEQTWGLAWSRIFGTLSGNPWAAMPSLHFATSLMAAILLTEAGGRTEAVLGWGYAGALGFALVYLGEHYVTDLLAGAAIVAIARKGESLAEPLVEFINSRLRRLEAIAAG